MGAHDPFQIQSLIIEFEMNHTLPLALSKVITRLLREVFPDAAIYSCCLYPPATLSSVTRVLCFRSVSAHDEALISAVIGYLGHSRCCNLRLTYVSSRTV